MSPTLPAGRGEAVVIESGGAMAMENCWVAVCAPLSATRTVKVELPAVVGVPLITPAADSVSPPGRDPALTDQVYGGNPLAAARVTE